MSRGCSARHGAHFLQSMTRLLPSMRRNWVWLVVVGRASYLPANGCPLTHFSLQVACIASEGTSMCNGTALTNSTVPMLTIHVETDSASI